jgi:ABC-type bacteriocin/lantibiotic exporter with double-glycine peptidase domain
MSDALPLLHFQQSAEGYCLPTCVRMVLAYLGLERSETEISRILGAQEFGTPSFAVQRLTTLGLRVIYREWSIPQLLDALDAGQPVILFVRTGMLDHWQEDVAHAVVAVGAEERERFWLHDPALPTGPTVVSWNGLLAAWAEFGYRGAAIAKFEEQPDG